MSSPSETSAPTQETKTPTPRPSALFLALQQQLDQKDSMMINQLKNPAMMAQMLQMFVAQEMGQEQPTNEAGGAAGGLPPQQNQMMELFHHAQATMIAQAQGAQAAHLAPVALQDPEVQAQVENQALAHQDQNAQNPHSSPGEAKQYPKKCAICVRVKESLKLEQLKARNVEFASKKENRGGGPIIPLNVMLKALKDSENGPFPARIVMNKPGGGMIMYIQNQEDMIFHIARLEASIRAQAQAKAQKPEPMPLEEVRARLDVLLGAEEMRQFETHIRTVAYHRMWTKAQIDAEIDKSFRHRLENYKKYQESLSRSVERVEAEKQASGQAQSEREEDQVAGLDQAREEAQKQIESLEEAQKQVDELLQQHDMVQSMSDELKRLRKPIEKKLETEDCKADSGVVQALNGVQKKAQPQNQPHLLNQARKQIQFSQQITQASAYLLSICQAHTLCSAQATDPQLDKAQKQALTELLDQFRAQSHVGMSPLNFVKKLGELFEQVQNLPLYEQQKRVVLANLMRLPVDILKKFDVLLQRSSGLLKTENLSESDRSHLDYKARIGSLKAQAQVDAKMAQMQSKILVLEKALEAEKKANLDYKDQNERLKVQLEHHVLVLEAHNENLQNALQKEVNQDYEAEIKSLEAQNEIRKRNNLYYKAEIESLKDQHTEEKEKLKREIKEVKEAWRVSEDLLKTMMQEAVDLRKSKQSMEALQKELSEMKLAEKDQLERYQKLQMDFAKTTEINLNLKSQIDKMSKDNQLVVEESANKHKKLAEMEVYVSKLKGMVHYMDQELNEFENKEIIQKYELAEKKKELVEMEKKMAKLEEELRKKNDEIEFLNEDW